MGGESPDVVLYDSSSNALAVQNGSAIPASTPALMVAGSDGTNSRYIAIDSSGRVITAGAGTAGTPAGGVLSIQGVAGGTAVPISGTITINGTSTANQGTANTIANSWPVEMTDGTNILGTATHPVRIDPTGTTTQPVSGTVTANAGSGNFAVVQATAANLNATVTGTITANIGTTNGLALDSSVNGILVAQGSTTSGEKGPLIQGAVTTASPTYTTAQTSPLSLTTAGALRIDGSAVTQPVSGTVTANAGTGTFTVGQATAANLNATVVQSTAANLRSQTASESTTATTTGTVASLTGGAVTTAAPTYTTGQMDPLSLTTAGALRIDGSGVTQPVSGTITANIGTTNGLALDTTLAKLTITQGTALGSNTLAMVGGSVTTASPTYTTGNINPLSLTTAGALRIDGSGVTQPVSGTVTANQGGAPWSQNITQFGGVNISTGTGASGTGIPRVTVANDSNILATQSGTWTVQPGNTPNTTPWLVTDSSDGPVTPGTVAGKSSLMGGQFNTALPTLTNTQQSAIQLDSSGRVLIGSIPTGANVIGAVTQSGSWTVTANAGTGNFSVVGTGTDNTTNSTAKLPVLAAVSTTAAPTYTTGNMVPLSVDTSGNLRITGSISATNPSVSTTGTAPPASATYIGGSVTTSSPTYTTGQMNALSLTTAGALRIDGSGTTQPVSGTITANQGTANTLANRWPVIVTDGTNTMPTADTAARAQFDKITDGTNTAAVKPASTAAVATDPALVVAVSPNNTVTVVQTTATNLNVEAAQGTSSIGNAWFEKITDGTNTAAVKASSAAPVAADPALVVTMSPNSPNLNDSTATGALGALNAAVQISLAGQHSAGMQLVAGTLIGTIVPEISMDGGTTWVATFFDDPATGNKTSSIVFAANNTATTRTIVGAGGASTVRVRVSAFTSGTATCNLRSSDVDDPSVLFTGAVGSTMPPVVGLIGTKNTSGNVVAAIGDTAGAQGVDIMSNTFSVHSNSTITTSGSQIISNNYYGVQQISLVVNVKAAPTGTTPTITFTIQEVDPGDNTTVFGSSDTTGTINAIGIYTATLDTTTSGSVKVTWTITGTTPSFTQVYSTVVSKNTPTTQAVSSSPVTASRGIAIGYITTTATTNVPIFASTFIEQATNAQRSVVSTSANDAAAGTGARTILLTYYDQTGAGPFTETITLNGTTAVNTVGTNICYVEQIEVLTVGTNLTNVGAINLHSTTAGGGTVIAAVNAGDNETFYAHHYVSSTKTCYVTDISGYNNNSTNGTLIGIKAKALTTNAAELQFTELQRCGGGGNNAHITLGTPITINGPARLILYGAPEGTPSILSRATFSYYDL